MIDRATVEKIVDAAKIVDVVGEFVTLKKSGVNYKGLCPFHDDRNPSAFIDVNPSSSYYGMFFCTSTSCHKTATLRKVLEEIGAM